VNDSFYEEIGDFNAKVGRHDVFKLTIGSESLYETNNNNNNRVGLANFAPSKNLRVKGTMLDIGLGHLRMGKPTIRLTIF
jgi:hypothetical protein